MNRILTATAALSAAMLMFQGVAAGAEGFRWDTVVVSPPATSQAATAGQSETAGQTGATEQTGTAGQPAASGQAATAGQAGAPAKPSGPVTGKLKFWIGNNFTVSEFDDILYDGFAGYSNNAGEIDATMTYKGKSFDMTTTFLTTNTLKKTTESAINSKVNDEVTQLSVDLTQVETLKNNIKVGNNMIYRFSPFNRIEHRISYGLVHEASDRNVSTVKLGDKTGVSISDKDELSAKHTISSTLLFEHKFHKPGRIATAELIWDGTFSDKNTVWTIEDLFDEDETPKDKKYRLTPINISRKLTTRFTFDEKKLAGVEGLDLKAVLNVTGGRDRDIYAGSNYVNMKWVDSTRIAEAFDHRRLVVQPSVNLTYKVSKLTLKAGLSPHYYTDWLRSDGEVDEFVMTPGKFSPLPNGDIEWKASTKSRLYAGYVRTIEIPEYLKMCVFMRPGKLPNELIQGNTDLKPSSKGKATLGYEYTGEKFKATVEAINLTERDRTEQTYHNEKIDEEDYRIYTWVNAGYANTSTAHLNFKYDSKSLKSSLDGKFNHVYNRGKDGKEKTSNNFSAEFKTTYTAPFKLEAETTFTYQSKTQHMFNTISRYVQWNLELRYPFKFGGTVFVGCNDILDTPLSITTESQDGTEFRSEEFKDNRRIFRVGMNCSF